MTRVLSGSLGSGTTDQRRTNAAPARGDRIAAPAAVGADEVHVLGRVHVGCRPGRRPQARPGSTHRIDGNTGAVVRASKTGLVHTPLERRQLFQLLLREPDRGGLGARDRHGPRRPRQQTSHSGRDRHQDRRRHERIEQRDSVLTADRSSPRYRSSRMRACRPGASRAPAGALEKSAMKMRICERAMGDVAGTARARRARAIGSFCSGPRLRSRSNRIASFGEPREARPNPRAAASPRGARRPRPAPPAPTRPLCVTMIFCTSARPRPVPRALVVKKGRNIRSATPASMPGPLSLTVDAQRLLIAIDRRRRRRCAA